MRVLMSWLVQKKKKLKRLDIGKKKQILALYLLCRTEQVRNLFQIEIQYYICMNVMFQNTKAKHLKQC